MNSKSSFLLHQKLVYDQGLLQKKGILSKTPTELLERGQNTKKCEIVVLLQKVFRQTHLSFFSAEECSN